MGEVLQTWNIVKLARMLSTHEQGLVFAEEQGLILKTKKCRIHKNPMKLVFKNDKTMGTFVCSKGSCHNKTRVSRAQGTWFENVKLKLGHIYYLMYCFAYNYSHDMVIHEDIFREEHCLSRPTISDWYNYCREVVVIYQLEKQEVRGKIGGPGKIVQVDESKFGKRKFNKGIYISH